MLPLLQPVGQRSRRETAAEVAAFAVAVHHLLLLLVLLRSAQAGADVCMLSWSGRRVTLLHFYGMLGAAGFCLPTALDWGSGWTSEDCEIQDRSCSVGLVGAIQFLKPD